MAPRFAGGRNIAMKVPPHQYDATIAFYRDVLGLEPVGGPSGTATGFAYGACNLWIDRGVTVSQAEIWLEVVTDDTDAAAEALASARVARCDAIEALGEGFDGFWISSPAAIVHLVDAEAGSWD